MQRAFSGEGSALSVRWSIIPVTGSGDPSADDGEQAESARQPHLDLILGARPKAPDATPAGLRRSERHGRPAIRLSAQRSIPVLAFHSDAHSVIAIT